jgi:hypothetical protein
MQSRLIVCFSLVKSFPSSRIDAYDVAVKLIAILKALIGLSFTEGNCTVERCTCSDRAAPQSSLPAQTSLVAGS